MSLANFIKTILNVQDDNISFPEEDYCQIIQKGNNVELNLSIQRHICKDCKKTFSPSTSIAKDISNNLKYTIAQELQENISLTFIAKKYNLSISSVQRIMDVCYSDFKVNKDHLPETMCIDEFKSVKNIDGAMSFVFADYQTKNIIDIVEDRRLNSLTEYFSRFSLEARNNVKYICMDMYSPYISLVKSIFPESEIVLDKFHIVNLVSRAFNQTRISIMNSLKDDSLKRKLKLFWKLLQKYYPDLC